MKTCPVCDTDYPDQRSTCPTDGAVLIESRELAPGSLVRGKYRIVCKLGQGGMGVIYLAEDILLSVRVALKFLAGDLGKDPRFIKRFRIEARAAYQLRHPNIVEVTNLDQAEDGSLFIAMEYVEGPSLRSELEQSPGGFAIPRALELARDIAAGLAAAHAQGTVHRDVKPENILLSRTADGRERPKVLDFGIVAVAETVTRLSLTRGLMLTPDYAAPEQWLEMPSAEIDGRTDLYALGCVLYEMLTGRPPFHAHNTSGWMKQHLEQTPRPPSELRPELAAWVGLDALLLRLLGKFRELRPQNAAEVIAALDAVRFVPTDRRPTVAEDDRGRPETIQEAPSWRPTPHPEPELPEKPETRDEPVIASEEFRPRSLSRWDTPPVTKAGRTRLSLLIAGTVVVIAALGLIGYAKFFRGATPQSAPQPKPVAAANPPPKSQPPPETSPTAATPEPPPAPKPTRTQGSSPTAASPATSVIAQQGIALFNQGRNSEANPVLDRACKGGSWEACTDLGSIYGNGFGVPKDLTRAGALYSRACDGGFLLGCVSLGRLTLVGHGVPQDTAKALALFQRSCNGGLTPGCNNLGAVYRDGTNVPRDPAKAAGFFRKGCNMGDASSCSFQGNLYDSGAAGLPPDYNKAAGLFKKGCDGGDDNGCAWLGNLTRDGQGVPRDPAKAAALFQKGCDGRAVWACTNLGVMYARSDSGIALNYAKAAALFKKGCDGGNHFGCGDLANFYRDGRVVPQDKAKAKQLYEVDCAAGTQSSCDQLKKLK